MNSWQTPVSFSPDDGIIVCSCRAGSDQDGARKKETAKKQIARSLMQALLPGSQGHDLKLELGSDVLGRPLLSVPGISISFSTCNGRIYGAAAAATRLGIDVAGASEFGKNYPFRRVFHRAELALIQEFGHSLSEAAAVLWSCKEAVVKAMGTGFRNIEPLDIRIKACRLFAGNYTVEVDTRENYSLSIHRLSAQWLAIAL